MSGEGISRRWFLGSVVAAAAGVTVATAGQTTPWLRGTDVLAPRTPGEGRGLQAIPVNRTAEAAAVATAAMSPDYRLGVSGAVTSPLSLTLADLEAMGLHSADLPLTCVEGWSVAARWSGVRLPDLLSMAGARPGAEVRVESLETNGSYRTSHLNSSHAWSTSTLLATAVDGVQLDLDHGYPVRLFSPNRPGVLQTKWLSEVVVL